MNWHWQIELARLVNFIINHKFIVHDDYDEIEMKY